MLSVWRHRSSTWRLDYWWRAQTRKLWYNRPLYGYWPFTRCLRSTLCISLFQRTMNWSCAKWTTEHLRTWCCFWPGSSLERGLSKAFLASSLWRLSPGLSSVSLQLGYHRGTSLCLKTQAIDLTSYWTWINGSGHRATLCKLWPTKMRALALTTSNLSIAESRTQKTSAQVPSQALNPWSQSVALPKKPYPLPKTGYPLS